LAQKTIYPVKDSKSYISPYSQRDHSWNDAQHDQSNEVTWSKETNTTAPNSIDWVVNGQGPNSRLFPGDPNAAPPTPVAALSQFAYHDAQSRISPYDQREDAWTDNQADKTNEVKWNDHIEKVGADYHDSAFKATPEGTLAQKTIYPVKDSKSYISPYSQRDHSWNDAQHDQSNEVTWSKETNTTAPNSIDWVVNGQGPNSRLFPGDPNAAPPTPVAALSQFAYHDGQSRIAPYEHMDDAWSSN